jgi:hypothetical protein
MAAVARAEFELTLQSRGTQVGRLCHRSRGSWQQPAGALA